VCTAVSICEHQSLQCAISTRAHIVALTRFPVYRESGYITSECTYTGIMAHTAAASDVIQLGFEIIRSESGGGGRDEGSTMQTTVQRQWARVVLIAYHILAGLSARFPQYKATCAFKFCIDANYDCMYVLCICPPLEHPLICMR
jgi:hypothetical protein